MAATGIVVGIIGKTKAEIWSRLIYLFYASRDGTIKSIKRMRQHFIHSPLAIRVTDLSFRRESAPWVYLWRKDIWDHRSSIHCLHKCNLQKKLLGSRKTAGWARPFNELAEVFSQNVQSLHSSLRMLGWSYSGEDLDPIKLGLWDSDRVTTVGALSLPIIIGLFGELDLWGLYRWSPITARKRAWFPSFSTEVAVWGDAQART